MAYMYGRSQHIYPTLENEICDLFELYNMSYWIDKFFGRLEWYSQPTDKQLFDILTDIEYSTLSFFQKQDIYRNIFGFKLSFENSLATTFQILSSFPPFYEDNEIIYEHQVRDWLFHNQNWFRDRCRNVIFIMSNNDYIVQPFIVTILKNHYKLKIYKDWNEYEN